TIARLAASLAETGLPVAAHAEDPSVLLSTSARVETYADLLSTRPAVGEAVAVAAMGALAANLGLRVHIVHLSSRAGLEAALAAAHAGSPGVQTLLLSCLELARQAGDPLAAVPWVTEHPARIFGLYPRKGTVQPGSDADLVLVDPSRRTLVKAESMLSRQRKG